MLASLRVATTVPTTLPRFISFNPRPADGRGDASCQATARPTRQRSSRYFLAALAPRPSGSTSSTPVVRARDDVDGDHFAHAAGGEAAGVGGGLHRGHVAADDRRDVAAAGLLEADEFDLGGFDHRVGAFHHCGKGPCFQ